MKQANSCVIEENKKPSVEALGKLRKKETPTKTSIIRSPISISPTAFFGKSSQRVLPTVPIAEYVKEQSEMQPALRDSQEIAYAHDVAEKLLEADDVQLGERYILDGMIRAFIWMSQQSTMDELFDDFEHQTVELSAPHMKRHNQGGQQQWKW